MFSKEVKTIKEQYNNSITLIDKLNEVYKPYEYGGAKRNNVFYLDVRIQETHESIKIHAFSHINNIIKNNRLNAVKGDFGHYSDNRTLDDAFNTLKNINIQTFFDSLCYYQPYYTGNREVEKFVFDNNKMFLFAHRFWAQDCILLLNCLWLITGHNEIMDWELRNKINKKIENGETFIFCTCKVQLYKNGKLNVFFSDPELYKKFVNLFNKGLKNAQIEYNKRNKEA